MDEDEESKEFVKIEPNKTITAYQEVPGRKTQFFLPDSPDVISDLFEDYQLLKQDEEEIKVEIDPDTYKAKIFTERFNVDLVAKITRVGEENNFCVEFTRKSGDMFDFLNFCKALQNFIEYKLGYKEEEPEEGDDDLLGGPEFE